MKLRAFMIAAAVLAACRSSEVTLAELPSAGTDYFFFVAIDRAGEPSRTSAMFGTRDGSLSFGGSPIFQVREEDRGALLVGLSRAMLDEHGFDAAREEELAVRLGAPPEPARRVEGDFLEAALPDEASIAEAVRGRLGDAFEAITVSARMKLALEIPIAVLACDESTALELRPFGATALLLPGTTVLPFIPVGIDDITGWYELGDLAHVDRDRVVANTGRAIVLLRRGASVVIPQRFDDLSIGADYVPLAPLGGPGLLVRSVTIDRTRSSNGRTRVLASGARRTDTGAIWELDLDDAGLHFVSTATIHARAGSIGDVAIDARGYTLAVGEADTILMRAPGAEAFEPVDPIEQNMRLEMRRAIATNDPAQPFAISEDHGVLYLGDPVTGAWTRFNREDRPDDRRFYMLATTPAGDEHWASGPRGTLFRWTRGDGWNAVRPKMPASIVACERASGADGLLSPNINVTAVGADRDAAFVVVDDCSALLRFRRSDLCGQAITVSGLPADDRLPEWKTLGVFEDRVLVAGMEGGVYEVVVR